MMSRIVGLCVVLSIVVLGSSVNAQEDRLFSAGDRTFTIGGSGGSDKDFEVNYVSVQAGASWFLADSVSVGIRQELNFIDVYGSDEWSGSTRVGIDYVMSWGMVSPYLGVNVGYVYGDAIEDQFIAGPNIGLRIFLNETTFISMATEYQVLFEAGDEASDVYDDGRLVYVMGIGVKL